MSGLPSGGGGHGAQHHLVLPNVASEFLAPAASAGPHKRKRRPAGTPDPSAEVVALSPKTLMESDRYVCEICNQGFQRDQNLQMHRRRHKVPWKLLKKPSSIGINKRVYICPERSCLHHDPTHALGDLVGIKKHYRRKHCTEKQWKCVKCSKRYAVQSDYKAHLKTCGTRGHCCDCGRVFSRVESFIEHQDTCSAVKHKSMQSGVNASEGKLPVHQHGTDRNSHDSPSQSSDTTQAMSFAKSGMSDTTDDDRSRRRLEAQQTTAATYAATEMPAWLMDRRSNELELLQPAPTKQQRPPGPLTGNLDFLGIRRVVVDDSSSRSQVTRCSNSINSAGPEVSFTESKTSTFPEDVNNTPSLQLSIGPYVSRTGSVNQTTTSFDMHIPCLRLSIGPSSANTMAASSCPSPCADTKPAASFGSVCSHERPAVVGVRVLDYKTPHPIGGPNDLALWIAEPARNQTMGGPPAGTPDQAASLRDFLAQAWRPGVAMQGCVSR